MNKYGLRLKKLRESAGYSQQQLADILNTSRSRIGMYEQGRREPDFEMQEAIADLFNVSMNYLFARKNTNDEEPPISPDEQALVLNYRRLNAAGRDHINRQMSFAVQQPDFLKNTDAEQSTG